ncbi:DUF7017 domain-containing protein [Cecembia calidifontis]|uniref:TOTE conflict systems S1/CSD-like domain-containing protein n=1 Tax=Cecembia calidifontis TaxID=1187080 RepID=A0A4Q7PA55_9BACT|nr:hypothetical protein [Cecembia calidifontis]RZS97133.1 hypothetical protein BC751_2730 [Cecembia calidifontis]
MNQQLLKQLRAENRFEDAYKLTKNELLQKQDDIWAKRNHSWSLYYLIKKHVQAGQTVQAKHFLDEFTSLQMPITEALLHERMEYFFKILNEGYLRVKQLVADGKYSEAFDFELKKNQPDTDQLSWIVYYLLKSHNKTGKPDNTETLGLLNRHFEFYRPTKKLVSKLILQELVKTSVDFWSLTHQSVYLEKAGLYDILEEDDFQKQEWEGKKIISLAERLHISYSKALLREKADEGKITAYIEEIVEPILETYPGMLYVPYFKAKLLLGTGNLDTGIKAFLPFAKKKSGEFWVWQVFAEAYEGDLYLYFSCLCKAMTCKTKPEFLSNIQEKLIAYLVKTEQYNLAKAELEKLMRLREKQGWGLKSNHRQYMETSWFFQSQAAYLNYSDHIALAESLLENKSTETILVVVNHVNREKKVFSFLVNEHKFGFGNYIEEPNLWGIYKLTGNCGTGDYFHVKKIEASTSKEHPLLSQVLGKFNKREHNSFGFINGKFVEPNLVEKHSLKHNDLVEGTALLAPVKGKKEWAWKMIFIQKSDKEKG